jgi:hypothetical protein
VTFNHGVEGSSPSALTKIVNNFKYIDLAFSTTPASALIAAHAVHTFPRCLVCDFGEASPRQMEARLKDDSRG